jgi:amino acid transporter
MALFTVINLMGAKLLSDSNTIMVIWKAAVPILTIVVIMSLSFHSSNFTAGGGFLPFGMHGVFAALPLGVVFALQGFEQAVQMGGEARNPSKDISRAIISAMFIGAAVYILLEVAFIGGLAPHNVAHNWNNPIGAGDFSPYYTIAIAVGAAWLGTILLVDAVISPGGTGLIYLATSARLSYALGEDDVLPDKLTDTNRRGVPMWSILLAFVIGEITFLPFPSWSSLVGLVTEATAIMYAFAPVSLAALHLRDPDRQRPYRAPLPQVLNPLAFVAANLIIYWSGFEANWKILAAIFLGRVFFEIALRRADDVRRTDIDWRAASWIWPWLIGMVILGLIGRYGGHNALPEWVDLAVVIAFSLVIFYYAVSLAMEPEKVKAAIKMEERQSAAKKDKDLNLPG